MGEALHVVVSGTVQGVGFRYAARAAALRLGLRGWVRNRADGTVEAWFEGPRPALEAALAWCQTGPRWAAVSGVQHEWSKGETCHESFEIRG